MTDKPWRKRLVEDVLPLCTSLVTHGVILIIVAIVVRTLVVPAHRATSESQAFSPEMGLVATELPQGDFTFAPSEPGVQESPAEETPAAHVRFAPEEGGTLEVDSSNADSAPAQNLIGLARFTPQHDGTGGRRSGSPFGIPNSDGVGTGGKGGGGKGVFGPPRGVRSVAFVCDASGSMLDKFSALRQQLQNGVARLKPIHSFNVIFFQESRAAAVTSGAELLPATSQNVRKATEFVEDFVPSGATDPIPALELALRQRPELIWLLTDGDFPDNDAVVQFLRKRNAGGKVRINTIAFVERGEAYERVLKTIADENGGTFRYVGEEELR